MTNSARTDTESTFLAKTLEDRTAKSGKQKPTVVVLKSGARTVNIERLYEDPKVKEDLRKVLELSD